MSNILITGKSGFLGKILERCLEEDKKSTYGLGNNNLRIDISKPFDLPQENFDIIIHAAGKAHSIPKSKVEEKLFYEVNFDGTKNLSAAIDKLAIKPASFIFISTVAVYGVDKGEMVNELHPLNGETPYSKSKILAENFLIDWSEKSGIKLAILRLPLVAGQNPPGNLGAMIKGIKTGRYLSIGKADAKKSIVWAEDIAHIIPKISIVGGIYNLTDSYHPSFGELEKHISAACGKSIPKKIPLILAKAIARVGDFLGATSPINTIKLDKITSTLTFDNSKALKELNWVPSKVLDKIPGIV
jgi:nucleoside-diphosphate-sugar epimerase